MIKKFILKTTLFIFPVLAYCIFAALAMPRIISTKYGPSTEQQISKSFRLAMTRKYDLLILGNSRTYRGINPDMLNIPSLNFSHDADSYNQIYYKLKYVLQKKPINYLILNTDYFMFSIKLDTRNYVYCDYFDNNYTLDYSHNALYTFQKKAEYLLNNIHPKNLLHLRSNKIDAFLKDNGQYIKPGKASEKDKIDRNIDRLQFQVDYFEKVLYLCKQEKIRVFIVTLPTRQEELDSYSEAQIKEFNTFISTYVNGNDVFYFNHSLDHNFKTNDFTDITHLNESAADRFSKILNNNIMGLIPDTE